MNLKKIKFYGLAFFLFGFILFSFLAYLSFVFLKNNNEHLSINSIVEKQIKDKSLYSSSINIDYRNYVKKKYELIKPKILIIGSSRMQYYPKYLFDGKLIIAQQPFYSFDMFYSSLENLIKIHKPELVIVGLDWWLFNENYNKKQSKIFYNTLYNKKKISKENKSFFQFSFNELVKPYLWLVKGKISVKFFLESLKGKSNTNIGVMANLVKSGYNLEGYFSDTYTLSGKKKFDIRFKETLDQIKNKKKDFTQFKFDQASLKIFKKINKLVKLNNVAILNILSPVSPTIYNELIKSGYLINFEKISSELKKFDNFYDLTQKNYFHDCQFLDGIHSGEVLNFINLKEISKANSTVEKLISKNISKNVIQTNLKRVVFKNLNVIGKEEKDFLEIGCEK